MLKILNSPVHTKLSVAEKFRRNGLPQIVNPAPVHMFLHLRDMSSSVFRPNGGPKQAKK